MIALDTNALVRIAANDAPQERQRVLDLLQGQKVLVLKTVLLETAWVLRSRYGYAESDVYDFFDWLAELEDAELEDSEIVVQAIASARKGLDFADALHMASARKLTLFTLDKRFQKKAAGLGFDVKLVP